MNTEKFIKWKNKVPKTKSIYPARLGTRANRIISEFGEPEEILKTGKEGQPLVFRYQEIEFHYDEEDDNKLFLVCSREDENFRVESQKFPPLESKQVAVARTESTTEYVVDNNFKLYSRTKGGEIYTVFKSLYFAKKYIDEQKAIHKDVDFWVYNEKKSIIFRTRLNPKYDNI